MGRASPPSAGSAGPSHGCRRSGPPGRSRHISPPHPGSPPWLALSSASSSSAATGGRTPRPRRRLAGPGWGRAVASGEESRGSWRRRRPGRTGGLTAPPPHGGLPAPRGPLRREPHPSGPPDRAPGPGSRRLLGCPCAAPTRSEPTNVGGGGGGRRAIPARLPAGGFRRGGDPASRLSCAVPPDLPARPTQAGARLPGRLGDGWGWGRFFTGAIPGIEGPASGPPQPWEVSVR